MRCLVLVVLLLVSCAPAPEAPARPPTPWAGLVDAYGASYGAVWGPSYALSGALLIAKDGNTVYQRAYGPVNADTEFRVGSLTKQFTAVAVLQLVGKGNIALDASVRQYRPELPETFEAVTIRHLLNHTSGISNYTSAPRFEEVQRGAKPEEVIALFRDKPLAFPPGTKFDYSNSNYFLLGLVIERATGKSYEEVLQENVLGPAGMLRSGTNERSPRSNVAVGYTGDDAKGRIAAPPMDITTAFAAGDLHASANDLVAWDRALTKGALLGPAEEKIRTTPALDEYACGVIETTVAGAHVELHSGHVSGFAAFLARVPQRGLAVIWLGNDDFFDSATFGKDVLKMVLTNEPAPPHEERAVGVFDATAAQQVAGTYAITPESEQRLAKEIPADFLAAIRDVRVTVDGQQLLFTHGKVTPTERYHAVPAREPATWFTRRDGIVAMFEADGSLRIEQGTLKARFARVEDPR